MATVQDDFYIIGESCIDVFPFLLRKQQRVKADVEVHLAQFIKQIRAAWVARTEAWVWDAIVYDEYVGKIIACAGAKNIG